MYIEYERVMKYHKSTSLRSARWAQSHTHADEYLGKANDQAKIHRVEVHNIYNESPVFQMSRDVGRCFPTNRIRQVKIRAQYS